MQIVELTDEEDILATYPLLNQLYTELTYDQYKSYIQELLPLGYRRIVMKDQDNTLVASAGILVGVHFRYGKYLYVNDLITDENHRSLGLGTELLDWIEAEGIKLGCNNIRLASNVNRTDAHRFYFRDGFKIHGYYFVKELE